jgi:hypothetical protein
MFNDYSAIGVFARHQDAENAVKSRKGRASI